MQPRQPRHQSLEGYLHFEPGEWGAEAVVDTAPEADVGLVTPPYEEGIRLFEVAGVAVRASEQHGHLLVLAYRLPAHFVAIGYHPSVEGLDGCIPAEKFLDGGGRFDFPTGEEAPLVRMLHQRQHPVKVARAFTGRDLVLKLDGAYHGTYDGFEFASTPGDGTVPSTGGVPANLSENVTLGYWGDTDRVAALIRENADRLAAVILTPFRSAGGFAHPPPGFLETLRSVTADEGVLLLFDEVISLRLGMGGAQDRYGVVPDVTALGKLIGGGLPVGAFGGRAGGSLLSVACEPGLARPDVLTTGLALAFGNLGVFGFPYLSTSSVMEERYIEYVLESGATVLDHLAAAL